MKFIVTAGGQGTKIWPMSRISKPKQFQNIIGEKSLVQYQIENLLKAYSSDDIYISTKERYVSLVRKQLPEIDEKNIIIEPDFSKNRGPGEGYAFLKLNENFPNEPVMIVQSDCIREPSEKFLEFIENGERLVKKTKAFITGGQKAMYPDMGSDYLELGDQYKESSNNTSAYYINRFVDRLGDYKKTKKLIEKYNVSTHCNHLIWYPDLLLDAYKKYMPSWHKSLMEIRESFGKKDEREITNQVYSKMEEGPTELVTKHIMPGAIVMLVPFRWTDVGTWDAVYEYFKNGNSNYFDSEVIDIDTKNTYVKGRGDKLVATIGLNNIVIIDTKDALLVCDKTQTGDIKKVLEELKNKGMEEYL